MLDTTYLIVPNTVAQDERLNNFDKLLFGKIYSLTKQQGYCWATNEYFSSYFKESQSYISKSMKRLEKNVSKFLDLTNIQQEEILVEL